MSPELRTIPAGAAATLSARLYRAEESPLGVTFVLGHGAGAPQTHPFLVGFAAGLAARGVDVMTFNFPYAEAGARRPDRQPVLLDAYRAAIRAACSLGRGHRLLIGGKSLGGRIASLVAAADPSGIDGLVFLGYPLRPPGRLGADRSTHLASIGRPILFVQGTRDPFGTPDDLAPIARALAPPGEIFTVAGGDHSLRVPKRGHPAQSEVQATIEQAIVAWIERLSTQES